MKWLSLLVLLALSSGAARAFAQARASLGLGVGTVRFAGDSGGGTSFSSASFSPTLAYASPTLVADVAASVASLPEAGWSSQGRGSLWVASPPITHAWRIGVESAFAGTTRSDGGWTAAAHGLGEVLWSRPRWGLGFGAGPSSGWIQDEPSVTALHTRVRAWWRPDAGIWRTNWTLTVEPTRFPDGWFTDGSLGMTLERGPVIASLWTAARISSTYGSTGAGAAFLQFFVSPSIALEAGGGSYLRDPYQGLPLAGFVTIGVRLHGRPPRAAVALHRGTPAWSPLVPESHGDSLVVRFRFDSVRSLAIGGDWNQWQPMPLRALGGDLWEAVLALPRGIYHFNILVDGTEWVVPNGVATVSDGLGGMVGVLLVP